MLVRKHTVRTGEKRKEGRDWDKNEGLKDCGGRGNGTSLFSGRVEARRDLPVSPAPPYCGGTCRSCGSARCDH